MTTSWTGAKTSSFPENTGTLGAGDIAIASSLFGLGEEVSTVSSGAGVLTTDTSNFWGDTFAGLEYLFTST